MGASHQMRLVALSVRFVPIIWRRQGFQRKSPKKPNKGWEMKNYLLTYDLSIIDQEDFQSVADQGINFGWSRYRMKDSRAYHLPQRTFIGKFENMGEAKDAFDNMVNAANAKELRVYAPIFTIVEFIDIIAYSENPI